MYLYPSLLGDVGTNSGKLRAIPDTPYVFTFDMDFSKTAGAELFGYANNSNTDYATTPPTYNNTNAFVNSDFTVGYKGYGLEVAGILIYKSSLNNTDRTTVYNYLKSYYSIP
jgi:predicted secreted Zn-dependent protease